uniref:Peroxisomal membrane protein PMP22 n=1 Tax=Zea mays TaxID=4577 RepID=A0A804NPB1_MAIZE
MSEVVAMAGQAYMKQLQAHPLRTKAITSGVLAGCSDAVAQKISGVSKLQLRRLLLIALYGFAYAGPFGHFLHKLMDRFFKGKKGKETTAKKVLVEQLTASPWNNMMFMMYFGLVVEGRPFGQVKNKVKKDYASVQLTAWRVCFFCWGIDASIHGLFSSDFGGFFCFLFFCAVLANCKLDQL